MDEIEKVTTQRDILLNTLNAIKAAVDEKLHYANLELSAIPEADSDEAEEPPADD